MTDRPRILFWVQHLLGIGHLRRAAALSRGFRRAGMDVTLVSGGMPEPGVDLDGGTLVQLPPVRAPDGAFRTLVDGDGAAVDGAYRTRRVASLLDALRAAAPDALVTELFPFGRRQLRAEALALLDAGRAHARLAVASVRDVLVDPPRPERAREALARVETHYDRVLVHGDPDLIRFDETFPHAARIADRISYTGYVVDAPPPRSGGPGAGEVLVSAGGGGVGEALFLAAAAARPLTRLAARRWRFLVGRALDDEAFARISAAAGEGVTVERARPDFTSLLAGCALSVSQGGYNTVMETLAARARAVVVPYRGGHETEQTLRARVLEGRTGIRVLPEAGLDARTLAAAVDGAASAPRPQARDVRLDGVETSARLLREWLS